jgi:predicted dinucleotide-binding enzyme
MEKYAVFGTGTVGQSLAARLSETGNQVVVGTRNVGNHKALRKG